MPLNDHEKILYNELEELMRECNLSIENLVKAEVPNELTQVVQKIRSVVAEELIGVGKKKDGSIF